MNRDRVAHLFFSVDRLSSWIDDEATLPALSESMPALSDPAGPCLLCDRILLLSPVRSYSNCVADYNSLWSTCDERDQPAVIQFRCPPIDLIRADSESARIW